MQNSLKHKTVHGLIWSGLERFSVQGIQFLVLLIMARLLSPADYGIVGMLVIFLAISQSFIDSGFSNALIRKQNRTEADFSTVFYFNIGVGVFFYLVLFFTAPLIAKFYNIPLLTPVTRAISVNLIFNSLSIVPRAKFTINIDFKTQAKASAIAAIASGIVGIGMAYKGFGVWSMVAQAVINNGINTIMLWFYSRWIPAKVFSITSFKEMFSYGSKLLVAGLIDTIYRNLYSLIIGKKFTASDLGYYTRADQFAQFLSANLTGILGRVTFPILSSIQDNEAQLKSVYRKYLRLSAFVIFPLMMGLAALSEPLVNVLLTSKWNGVVILLQVICFAYMWYPIHAINLNLLQVKGRSDLFLKLEILKKVVGVSVLFITMPIGIVAMCVGTIFSSIFALIINTYYTGKLVQLGFFKQMRDLLPILLYAVSMGVIIWSINLYIKPYFLQLIVGIVIGVVYYLGISYMTKSAELKELISLLKRKND